MTILIVEDEERLANVMRSALATDGHHADVVLDAAGARERLAGSDVEMVLLDLMLPDGSGEELLAGLRHRRPDLPVLVVTAKDAVGDRVALLRSGADDYLVKPFSVEELLARVAARLRTSAMIVTRMTAGELTLDVRDRVAVYRDRPPVALTERQSSLLEVLVGSAGRVVGQDAIAEQAFDGEVGQASNVVEVYVSQLRRKLSPEVIETVRGVGYRLRA